MTTPAIAHPATTESSQCASCYGVVDSRARRCRHCTEWLSDEPDQTGFEVQRKKLQWFLFFLPAIYAVTYGVLYGIIIAVTH